MRLSLTHRYVLICAALLLAAAAPSAHANWLSRLGRIGSEVGEVGAAGGKAARIGIVELERAAAHIKSLAPTKGGAVLAAHATPEGHWKFVNRDGEVFTAGTPEELARVVPALLPDTAPGSRLGIYLSEDTLYRDRAMLKDLPDGADLHVVVGSDSYPLIARTDGAAGKLYAAVRPHLLLDVGERGLFDEALAQLERPLSRSQIRTLALEPDGAGTLSSFPRLDAETKAALVDVVDPASLAAALPSVRGQTVLVTGRIEDNLLYFRPNSGSEQSLKLSDLTRAAADNDVNLVILQADAPRQPGGRNWLWQRIAVDGLDDALKRAKFGDFLDALGAANGEFRVSVQREASGRVALRAVPAGGDAQPLTGVVGGWWTHTLSHVTGNVVTTAVEVHARDEGRQKELDRRLVPGIPSLYQALYLVGLTGGILGWSVASGWYARIWPPEQRSEYSSAFGYRAAQAVRLVAFMLIFLPIVGIPAVIVWLILQVWALVTLPVRAARWLFGRAEARAS
jgi:hypothetical protein